jgi:two-component system, chemotaxis family, chemotaxis protein CheY
MSAYKVLSVGQCGVDHPAIRRLLHSKFDAAVTPMDSAEDALAELRRQRYDLVLANRVFDLGGSGLDFISALKASESSSGVPVMLVSDLAAAQQQAVALGALPGFGKTALHQPETAERLAAALAGRIAKNAG